MSVTMSSKLATAAITRSKASSPFLASIKLVGCRDVLVGCVREYIRQRQQTEVLKDGRPDVGAFVLNGSFRHL